MELKAIDILNQIKNNNNKSFVIDLKDLNEAIKELEELENRSCENCKHWCQEFQSLGLCDKGIKEEKKWRETMTFHNFYCNKWESK